MAAKRLSLTKVHNYDRLTIWFDRTDLLLPLKRLRPHCAELNARVGQMRMNLRWKLKVEILQPKPSLYSLLGAAAGREISYVITAIEIACDFITETPEDAATMCARFLGSARVLHQRQPVLKDRDTFYFARRSNGHGKRGDVLVVYADRLSKLASEHSGQPCFHVEWRVNGSAHISALGIVSIDDLEHFDHEQFWRERVRMYQLPGVTRIGEILYGRGHQQVSDEALRKRARTLRKNHTLDGNVVLQNAAQAHPTLCRSLRHTDLFAWADAQTVDTKKQK